MKARIIKLIKATLGTLEWTVSRPHYRNDELLVMCYHSVPKAFSKAFKEQLQLLLKAGFTFLSPSDLKNYFAGELSDGPYVLLTFDDGLRNNFEVAQSLEELGAGAFFFIVPEFTGLESDLHPRYYSEVIRPIVDTTIEPIEEQHAMTWQQLIQLLDHGHCVGAHSFTHAMTAENDDPKTLHREVVEAKQVLEERLHTNIESFCSINQTDQSVNAQADALIRENYEYHFTTYPGTNTPETDPHRIYRRNAEAYWTQAEVKFALGKWMPALWARRNDKSGS